MCIVRLPTFFVFGEIYHASFAELFLASKANHLNFLSLFFNFHQIFINIAKVLYEYENKQRLNKISRLKD